MTYRPPLAMDALQVAAMERYFAGKRREMMMKVSIDVEDRKEAELIRVGLADQETRALVKVMGALLALPNDRARARTMRYVADVLAEGDAGNGASG